MKLSTVGQIAAWLWVLLVVLVAIGVPYFSIIATSLIRLRGYGLAAGNFTLDHYKELLQTPKALSSIWKSLFLAVSSATICSVLGTAVVVAVRKIEGLFQKGAGRNQSASRNAAEHCAGHRAHAVLELGLQGASDL